MFIDSYWDKIISLSSVNYKDYFIRHSNFEGHLSQISSDLDKQDATFIVRRDLRTLWCDNFNTISLESVNYLGYFLVVQEGLINLVKIDENSDSSLKDIASFEVFKENDIISLGSAKELWNQDGEFYIRHQDFRLKFQSKDGSNLFEQEIKFKIEAPQWNVY